MIAFKALLSQLSRTNVTEIVLQTGRPPGARVDGALEQLSELPMSGDDVVQALFSAGGSRYVDSLTSRPTQWRTRVEGVGAVIVSATARGDVVEAHFSVRDTVTTAPAQKARASSSPPHKAKSVRPPRGESPLPSSRRGSAGGPTSKRRHSKALPEQVPAPRMIDPAGDEARREHRGDELGADTPPPRHVPRGELPTLPCEEELGVDIAPGEIPSIPHPPPRLEEAFGPLSPRTLPEARFSRGAAPRAAPPIRRPTSDTPPEPVAAAPRPVSELSEPFAPSTRAPELSEPPPGPSASARHVSGRTTRPFVRDPHTPLLRKLLRTARQDGASDLHIVAGRPALLRIAGQVVPKGEALDAALVDDMIQMRVPQRLAATLERDGSCDFALEEDDLGRFRVNVSRQRTGLKASLRLIAAEVPTLAGLGLPDSIAAATRHHQGLIVITGPTGHGKTTTLAAIVDILNRETTRHIITVEDPIEHLHPRKRAMMSQREVGTHTRSFQSALKAALREDPDVIVVGELRDTETVRMALTASETGHLVLGTMSTPSAARTIDRLIDLFPPAEQQQVRVTLAGGLLLIVGQRLLPDADGRRMVAAVEVLPGMVPLWNLIRDSRTYQIPSLQQRGKGLGVIRLDESLADLVRLGRTTAAAAVAVAEAPDDLEQALGVRRPSQTMPRVTQTSPQRPPEAKPSDPTAASGMGGFLERAGALFGGKKAP